MRPKPYERQCEQCAHWTTGPLRPTKRLDGEMVWACEDCALDLEKAKDRAKAAEVRKGAA